MSPEHATRDTNTWAAHHLRELAVRLELEDDPHRPRAYRRAAETIDELGAPVRRIWQAEGAKGLEALPGIGPHIARTLAELFETGQLARLEQLREKSPVDVDALLAVDGIGPRTLRTLWQKLGVRTLQDLERVLDEGRVLELPGFGHKSEERLRRAVRIQRSGSRRVPLREAAAVADRLRERLARHPEVIRCDVAGSIRRTEASVGDIDLVVASNDAETVANSVLEWPEVDHIYSHGPYRVSVHLESGIDVDVRIVPPSCHGSALLYFTGSRGHTVNLRRLALAQGLRLNEYGLFRDGHRIAGETEAEVYAALALPEIPPPQRRGGSEIREALRRRD
jgi:DNA polymerase (family 10)